MQSSIVYNRPARLVAARCKPTNNNSLFSFIKQRVSARREERYKLVREWVQGEISLLKDLLEEQEKQLRACVKPDDKKPPLDADSGDDSDSEDEQVAK